MTPEIRQQAMHTRSLSNEELIEMLRKACNGKYYDAKEFDKKFPELPRSRTYHRRFGDWSEAISRAGIAPKHEISDTEMIAALKEVNEEEGSCRLCDYTKHRDLPSASSISKRFGSWTKALRAAGIEPKKGGVEKYSDEFLLKILKDACMARKKHTVNAVKDYPGMPTIRTFCVHFGTWNNALKKAGIID